MKSVRLNMCIVCFSTCLFVFVHVAAFFFIFLLFCRGLLAAWARKKSLVFHRKRASDEQVERRRYTHTQRERERERERERQTDRQTDRQTEMKAKR